MSDTNGIHQISDAEKRLLKKFIRPQSVLKITTSNYWKNYWKKELNEELQQVIDRLLNLGLLEPANQSEMYFSRQYTVAELREMLRTRNLPISGRNRDKGTMIEQLMASDPEGMMKTASKDLIHHLGIAEITQLLRKKGVDVYGTKEERIYRLLEVDPEGVEKAVAERKILICPEEGRKAINPKRAKKKNTMKSDRSSNLLLWIAGGVLVIMCFLSFLGPKLLTLISLNTTQISILTADTKAEWVETVTEIFNNSEYEISSGKTIHVTVMEQDSPGDAQQAVIDGAIQPTVWSPGDMSWVETANQVVRDRGNQPLVTGDCPRLVYAAAGFAMWQPMAEAMGWPDEPIGWDEIVELAADPEGWARYGHPEWEGFKFGHTHPEHSTTGFSMLATLAYAALNATGGLTPEKVKSEAVLEAFARVEQNTYHYGTSTRQLMDKMADRGPSYLHAVTASETATLKNNEVKQEKRFPYVFIFPAEGTFWSDNPACVLESEWVTDEQREAAQLYIDYLLAEEQQDVAVTIGLRPANPDVKLHDPISLEFGTDPRVSPQTVPPLEGVSGDVAAAIIDVFKQTKKKATVVVILDTSGSMGRGKKLENAVQGTISFLKRLAQDDKVFVYRFSHIMTELKPSGRAGDVVETLNLSLYSLRADGGTALYDSICRAVRRTESLDESDMEKRLYGVVVLSDGVDEHSNITSKDLLNCLPSGEDVEGVKVFTIAYGSDADEELLKRVAEQTNGKFFTSDPETIDQVYFAIAAEQ